MKKTIEKKFATKFHEIASKGICLKKHDDAINNLIEAMTLWMINLEKELGPKAREVIKNVQYEFGKKMALKIKEEYKIGNTLSDSIDLMWMFIIPFNIKMKVTKIDDNRFREEKTICPIYNVFKEHNVDFCEEFCISMTKGWLAAINPNLNCEMVKTASNDQYCIKDIFIVKEQKNE